jgi:hypothetical protein
MANGTPATHPLTGSEMRALRKHQRASPGAPGAFVFVSERGAPLSAPGFSGRHGPCHAPALQGLNYTRANCRVDLRCGATKAGFLIQHDSPADEPKDARNKTRPARSFGASCLTAPPEPHSASTMSAKMRRATSGLGQHTTGRAMRAIPLALWRSCTRSRR